MLTLRSPSHVVRIPPSCHCRVSCPSICDVVESVLDNLGGIDGGSSAAMVCDISDILSGMTSCYATELFSMPSSNNCRTAEM